MFTLGHKPVDFRAFPRNNFFHKKHKTRHVFCRVGKLNGFSVLLRTPPRCKVTGACVRATAGLRPDQGCAGIFSASWEMNSHRDSGLFRGTRRLVPRRARGTQRVTFIRAVLYAWPGCNTENHLALGWVNVRLANKNLGKRLKHLTSGLTGLRWPGRPLSPATRRETRTPPHRRTRSRSSQARWAGVTRSLRGHSEKSPSLVVPTVSLFSQEGSEPVTAPPLKGGHGLTHLRFQTATVLSESLQGVWGAAALLVQLRGLLKLI